jgi:NAD(P)-dependent dehydrogenase (short-subunit alcohol dehydrogenase family)
MDKSVAVVTGGTRGIGLGIAERLVQRGFSLTITYVSDEKSAQEALQYLLDSPFITGVTLDVNGGAFMI